ncbi:MAG: hypothetical protein LBE67_01670 [Kocuria palustris]|nr:hypothetical protein [Kocuria palustris]
MPLPCADPAHAARAEHERAAGRPPEEGVHRCGGRRLCRREAHGAGRRSDTGLIDCRRGEWDGQPNRR